MKIFTAADTRAAEQATVERGLSWLRLMENAGSAVSAAIRNHFELQDKTVMILCGQGGNGGDGFVVARKLRETGARVFVILTAGEPRHENAHENYIRALELHIPILDFVRDPASCMARMKESALLVDGIFGFGFHGSAEGVQRSVIMAVNQLRKPVVAIDLPSGVLCDTGGVEGEAIRAALTVTFSTLKPCHVLSPASDYCGRVEVASIGMPDRVLEEIPGFLETVESKQVDIVCRKRPGNAHKGDFGKPLLICGSYGMAGAAAMATKAALRSGAGVVTTALPDGIYPIVAGKIDEAVFCPLPMGSDGTLALEAWDRLEGRLLGATSILIGPGLGRSNSVTRLVARALARATCPVILDADGINAMEGRIELIRACKAPVILTPHSGEMARLLGCSVGEVEGDRLAAVHRAARMTDAVVILKGHRTLIAQGEKVWMNTTGNPGMATGGSGDVLAGMLAAFAGRGILPATSACAAVYYHGLAGDFAAAALTETAMLPGDLLQFLPKAFGAK